MGGKSDRLANDDLHLARPRENAPSAFQVVESGQVHRHDRNVQLPGKQANARAKGRHIARITGLTFRKDQNAPAAISEVASEAEALQKARLLRQRKDVEKTGHEKISQ